ncbi:hypothetical protein AAU57_14015 [Nonlabens sp. YIK11]|uniref:hypothetical protein n=1 Tax=Nonlabens sp. YIK11 TaxID=1453349 RepID=UPI0006DCFEF6|nr:hypothetical protein [Nonlabens sp. YIK11]KQC34329.1 hypothetical protein AAU57_14015 [Nonlabens sp. YIK11]
MTFKEYINTINDRSKLYDIGNLQDYRNQWKKINNNFSLFELSNTEEKEKWASHKGAHKEVQFNTSFEYDDKVRYGIALSIRLHQNLRDLTPLQKRFSVLNEIIENQDFDFSGYKMFRWHNSNRTVEKKVEPIPHEWALDGNFIFIGKIINRDDLEVEDVLKVFDDLLPLYKMIEERVRTQQDLPPEVKKNRLEEQGQLNFKDARTPSNDFTYTQQERTINAVVRHRALQEETAQYLANLFGDIVKTECRLGRCYIDLVADFDAYYEFYEIKTASTALGCIRQGLGQLLEYANYYSHSKPIQLTIVGEPKPTKSDLNYLRKLKSVYNIPIKYLSTKDFNNVEIIID